MNGSSFGGTLDAEFLAVCGKTGKFEVLPFRYGALCWWFQSFGSA